MFRRFVSLVSAILLVGCVVGAALGAKLSPNLATKVSRLGNTSSAGVVIVAFNSTSGLNGSHLNLLRSVGILNGITLPNLGMVAVVANVGQVKNLVARPEVRSVWSNDRLQYFMNQARVLTGVEKVRTDPAFTYLYRLGNTEAAKKFADRYYRAR